MKLGDVVWAPGDDAWTSSTIGQYLDFLRASRGLRFDSYEELHHWSVADVSAFWTSVWEFYDIHSHTPFRPGLADDRMPGATWFPGAMVNYAEHALSMTGNEPAVIERSQSRGRSSLSRNELRNEVARVRTALAAAGVVAGDRVATYCATMTEALLVYLASASLGAVYSSCPVEFGVHGVVSRLRQINPKIIFGVTGYRYGDRVISRHDELAEIAKALPELERMVVIPYLDGTAGLPPGSVTWDEFVSVRPDPLDFTPVEFGHPLVVVYSSGTTGPPKPIVHSHGGVLLEHVKSLGLQLGLGPHDRFFWHTTTGWMMWNYLISGLLTSSAIVLFDGDPGYPDQMALWRMAAEERVTVFGVSPRFLLMNRRAGIRPGAAADLSALLTVGCTGSPLELESYAWFPEAVSPTAALVSTSGGTDVLSALVCGAPIVPVYAGEISCPALGVDVDVIDSTGHPVTGVPGDLVVRQPMPSMPVSFWDDPDGSRMRDAYFAANPGLWTHGDWATITPRRSFIISGRSDATLNRSGVRIGTAELYAVAEEDSAVSDSLAVCLERTDTHDDLLVLFVTVEAGKQVDEALETRLKEAIRRQLSPRHVPDRILGIAAIPRTTSGKKAELLVKRILQGKPAPTAAAESVSIPPTVAPYLASLGAELRRPATEPAQDPPVRDAPPVDLGRVNQG